MKKYIITEDQRQFIAQQISEAPGKFCHYPLKVLEGLPEYFEKNLEEKKDAES